MTPADPMTLACALAEQAVGRSDPNPRVGCVIVGPDGRVIGQGSTQRAGQAHAEVMALRDVAGAPDNAQTREGSRSASSAALRGATAYVTLEPCSHHGRTPPCCDALVAAGVGRVVVALQDPNPLVAGRGLQRLREAGIAVELLPTDHPAAVHSRELNIGFFSRMQRGRPWVRMKIAASLDGRTALPDGRSQWITGEAARADGHAWRRRAGAVLTGIGTVREDDPRLDVRLVPSDLQPVRAVVDSRLEIAPQARILQPPGQVWIFHSAPAEQAQAWTRAWAAHAGHDARAAQAARTEDTEHIAHTVHTTRATLVAPSGHDAARHNPHGAAAAADPVPLLIACPGPGGKVDLGAMVQDLGRREINELHLEAGEKLNASLLSAGVVDELLLYVAPMLIGPGAGLAALPVLSELSKATRWRFEEITPVGQDLRLRLRPQAR